MPGKKLIAQDMSGIGRARLGSVMATVGKVLLWVDLLLLAFVYSSFKGGSLFWLWWVLAQGILGFALLGFGIRRRRKEIDRTVFKRAA